MLKNLNFKHVFYFWTVARTSSIRKASTVLNVSQSSISEQLKVLEANIGADLFDRSYRQMTLTLNGKVLFEALDDFFPNIEEVVEGISNYKTAEVKFLRIGLCSTLSQDTRHRLCFGLIEDFNYTVKILQGENSFLIEAFNKDEVDLVFTTNDIAAPRGKYEKLMISKIDYCIVAGKQLAAEIQEHDKIKSLTGKKFINYTPDSDLHFKAFDFMHQQKIKPIRIAEIDDINLIKSTLQLMNCFAILPITAVDQEIRDGSLFWLGPVNKDFSCELTAIYKPRFKSERFEQHLKDISNSIDKKGGNAITKP